MTISLAAISWVDEQPHGVRLRWRFPDGIVGLPDTVVIERAPVREWDQGRGDSVTDAVPQHWWEHLADIHLQGVPLLELKLPEPVDAIRYTQQGAARVIAVDETGRAVEDRFVADGDFVEIARPRLQVLRFLAFDVSLLKPSVLDLARDHDLDWQPIARIAVAKPLHGPFADVDARLPSNPLDDDLWQDLVHLVDRGEAGPGAWTAGEPTPWQALETVLGLRWAHAVAAGSGFVDGPDHTRAPVDEVDQGLVHLTVPTAAYAYRVLELGAQGRPDERSTIAVAPPGMAPPLAPPSPPVYIGGTVRLRKAGEYEATATVSWTQPDPLAIGVLLEETTSSGQDDEIECRSRRPEDPPGTGSLVRVRDVNAHDVTIAARATALDGWDRRSAPSALGPFAALDLVHSPTPPLLATGRWNGGMTRLDLAPPAPGASPWAPDALVSAVGGQVIVCRRTRDPLRAAVTAGTPIPLGDGLLDVPVSGAPGSLSFTGGRLLINGRSFEIVGERAGAVTVSSPASNTGPGLSFAAGPATLIEDAAAPAAWAEVHAVPANAVPDHLWFTEPHPLPASGADVCTYALRVGFLGRRGPLGNAVAVGRIIQSPPPPPPFTVDLLDVDALRRTFVEITLTNAASGEHVVAWARGAVSGDAFALGAAEGDLGPREPHDGRLLHEVLPLPIPRAVAEVVTVGVAKLGPAGTRSPYSTVLVTVPAPASP